MLHAHLTARAGDLLLTVDLVARPGETIVLLGPNGAGKSTLLRCVAGLHELESGRVELNGEVLDDVASGHHVQPERRRFGVVFQSPSLFPHLSCAANVAYGARAAGRDRSVARAAAAQALEMVGATALAGRSAAQLSGGETQRIALARALATGPRLLLLDEPLSAIDAEARAHLRRDLRLLLAGFAGVRIVVTHDPVEALALGDRLVVLEAGRVTQDGSPAEVTARPRTTYTAAVVGMNLLRGTAAGASLRLQDGTSIALAERAPAGECLAVFHPHAVSLHRDRPRGSARNVFAMSVVGLSLEAGRARVELAGPMRIVAEVTPAAVAELDLADGSRVFASFKATEVAAYSV